MLPDDVNVYLIIGVLYVVDRLDNEGVVRSYELTLRATDVMTGSYSETTVRVELEVRAPDNHCN